MINVTLFNNVSSPKLISNIYNNVTHIKFYFKFVLQEILNVPALAKPFGAFFVRFQSEPVVVRLLVVFNILQQ